MRLTMANDQGRAPPAYQEFAASMMANLDYRQMSVGGRGLLYSLKLECWVNYRLPADPQALARVIGFQPNEVRQLLPEVMPFFAIENDFIVCPELENYRVHLARIRAAQSDGGKHGSAVTNQNRKTPKPRANKSLDGNSSSDSQVSCEYTRESLVQSNPIQPSQNQSIIKSFAIERKN